MRRARSPLALALVVVVLSAGLATAALPKGPAVNFNNGRNLDMWYGHALQRGFNVQASGCDPGGSIVKLDISVETYGTAHLTTPNVCAWTALAVPAADVWQPGNLFGNVEAEDNAGNQAFAIGNVNLSLLPHAIESVVGFPDLRVYPEPSVGSTVQIDLVVGSAGNVRGHRLQWDGITWANTLWTLTPQAGDMKLAYTFKAYAGDANVQKDDAPRWIGSIRQQGLEWWHIVPLDDDGVALLNVGMARI